MTITDFDIRQHIKFSGLAQSVGFGYKETVRTEYSVWFLGRRFTARTEEALFESLRVFIRSREQLERYVG